MKKSNFVAMILGTISCIFFALGMCMALLPEWNLFKQGIVIGGVGIIFALITVFVWRRMEGKEPIKFTGKAIFTVIIAVIGAFALGIGMCFTMVWGKMIVGIIIGIIGIIILLSLIPICKGLN